MRQRNVKNKEEIISNSKYSLQDPSINKGKWQKVFNNKGPIYLEIGMGKGKFIVENALKYPNINFIGIEKSASIVALALKKISSLELSNLKIFCLDAQEVENIFYKEIDRLYLNFSDPWPKKRHAKRRLTSLEFLKRYDNVFRNDLDIELKTDNRLLFEYSLKSLSNYGYQIIDISLDLHHSDLENNIMTEYEEKFSKLNQNIFYVKCVKHK